MVSGHQHVGEVSAGSLIVAFKIASQKAAVWHVVHSGRILCPGILQGHSGVTWFLLAMAPMSLARRWERSRRLRRRLAKKGSWVVFPPMPVKKPRKNDDDAGSDSEEDVHPVSTQALALNADALACVVEHYGPNPVHIKPLQDEARANSFFHEVSHDAVILGFCS